MAYTKLFSSIITSTIWNEDDKTRILWITMLAIADKNGEVQGSVPGLARIAGIPIDDARTGIEKFLSPDPDSRTKDDEGRRIEVIEGGWLLLNHRKYREMASKEEAKESEAKRKARYREKLARNGKMSQNVPDKSQDVPKNLHIAEAEAEAEAKKELPPNPQGGMEGISTPRKKRLSPTEKRTTKIPVNTPTMIQIGTWFGRQPETLWTVAESESLDRCKPSDKELAGMEGYYLADHGEKDYRRTSVITLLNNWQSELDRAREWWKKSK